MIFHPTPLPGAYTLDPEKRGDERGFFARVFCAAEMGGHDLVTRFVQVNDSLSAEAGTLRGLHYQVGGAAETKLVRCIRGAMWDVIVDLRRDSAAFGRWFGATLSADNRTMVYCPKGFAHGFITLEPDTEALYFVDAPYAPEAERGLRWDDPWLGIEWPMAPRVMSEKDRNWAGFDPTLHAPG